MGERPCVGMSLWRQRAQTNLNCNTFLVGGWKRESVQVTVRFVLNKSTGEKSDRPTLSFTDPNLKRRSAATKPTTEKKQEYTNANTWVFPEKKQRSFEKSEKPREP